MNDSERIALLPSFPKVLTLGQMHTAELLDGEVEIKEKIDGSFIGFRVAPDLSHVMCRSKSRQLDIGNVDKGFRDPVDYVQTLAGVLDPDLVYYGEVLVRPRHNRLRYERMPKNNIVLFAVRDMTTGAMTTDDAVLRATAEKLDIDAIPCLGSKDRYTADDLQKLLETESYLGGQKIEGVVISRDEPWYWPAAGKEIPARLAKLVRDDFKETNRVRKDGTSKREERLNEFFDGFRTEARWEKAVQYLRDAGELMHDPKDIGKIMRRIHEDVAEEEEDYIRQTLFDMFITDIKRSAATGAPEWYKARLLERAVEDVDHGEG